MALLEIIATCGGGDHHTQRPSDGRCMKSPHAACQATAVACNCCNAELAKFTTFQFIEIIHADEYITSISFTYGDFDGVTGIKSLTITTNKQQYGPYGDNASGTNLTIPIKSGDVVGCFGYSIYPVKSLGEYVSLGPWGGKDGEPWSYIASGSVSQIIVHHCDVVVSIIFQSETGVGSLAYSDKFGGPGGVRTDKVCIHTPAEYLTAIYISFGLYFGHAAISSLRFQTKLAEYGPFSANKAGSVSSSSIPIESGEVVGLSRKGLYGPYGEEMGESFTSALCGGKAVGFFGRSGSYLNAIGIHMEYP
ncbi:hypothetical protein NMG60_11016275 [Bertholletia excelsa]